jgi:uncharacterized membrane protein
LLGNLKVPLQVNNKINLISELIAQTVTCYLPQAGQDLRNITIKTEESKMIKTLLVYAHLIAACLSVGILLIQDLSLAKTRGCALDRDAIETLKRNAQIVSLALVALWLSGLAIVVMGYMENPAYLMNQKLWAKFSVVGILTLNGFFLHYYSFPKVISPRGFLGSTRTEQFFVLLTGVISFTSWLYASYLGIARPWNNVAPYTFVMAIYGGILLTAFIIAFEYWRGLKRTPKLALN